MKIVDRVYDFSKQILRNQYMCILLFRAKHRKEDSIFHCMKMADGSVSTDIYILIPHTEYEATPESMFLHELGHCVNIALTGDSECPLEDFIFVMSLSGVN